MKKTDFSLKLMERILKNSGAKRVSVLAKQELALILKEYAEKIADLAIRNARHFGRKLITAEDIKKAFTFFKF